MLSIIVGPNMVKTHQYTITNDISDTTNKYIVQENMILDKDII